MGLDPGAWMRYSVALGRWVRYSGELTGPVYCEVECEKGRRRRRRDEQTKESEGRVGEMDCRRNPEECVGHVIQRSTVIYHTFHGAFMPTLDNALRILSRKPDLDIIEMALSSSTVFTNDGL